MGEGRNESDAVRAALIEAASRRHRRSTLVDEATRLAADVADSSEREAVMADMESVSAEWPPDKG